MSKKHKQALKFRALTDSLKARRAKAAPESAAAQPATDSRVLWGSAPIVLKHMELRCQVPEVALSTHESLMALAAICRKTRLVHVEIHRSRTLPTVEEFVHRAEAAFSPPTPSNLCLPLRKQSPLASRHATAVHRGSAVVTGLNGVGKSHIAAELTRRLQNLVSK
jgi:hypothetical protein